MEVGRTESDGWNTESVRVGFIGLGDLTLVSSAPESVCPMAQLFGVENWPVRHTEYRTGSRAGHETHTGETAHRRAALATPSGEATAARTRERRGRDSTGNDKETR